MNALSVVYGEAEYVNWGRNGPEGGVQRGKCSDFSSPKSKRTKIAKRVNASKYRKIFPHADLKVHIMHNSLMRLLSARCESSNFRTFGVPLSISASWKELRVL